MNDFPKTGSGSPANMSFDRCRVSLIMDSVYSFHRSLA
jgi:hypothetical protein